jgi:predicted ATP-binding protein involved in virulence
MKIDHIRLGNFRNFENQAYSFPTLFTVVIGENGKGKSSILEAIRIAAATFLLGIDEVERTHVQKEDIRRIDMGNRFVTQRNCFFEATGNVSDRSITWKRTLSRAGGKTDTKDSKELIELAQELNDRINLNFEEEVSMPVICFFSTARLWVGAKQTIKLKKKGSKLKDGYVRCVSQSSDKLSPMEWIKSSFWKKLKGKEDANLLNAVLEAIDICIPNWTPTDWDEDSDDLAGIYVQEDGSKTYMPLFYLSDGLRTMALMVAEIAYRCVILNDHFGNEAVRQSKGIVMVDEIDMHLHPNWQRTVVSDLKKAFPNIQFIVTTHSPFIVQSLQVEELINLDKIVDVDPENLGIEDVASQIMNVNPKGSKYEELYDNAQKYFETLERVEKTDVEQRDILKQRLDELSSQYQDDPAYVAFLKMNRLAKLGAE